MAMANMPSENASMRVVSVCIRLQTSRGGGSPCVTSRQTIYPGGHPLLVHHRQRRTQLRRHRGPNSRRVHSSRVYADAAAGVAISFSDSAYGAFAIPRSVIMAVTYRFG